MRKYYPATVVSKTATANDAVCIELAVPDEIREDFRYQQGQHLPVRAVIGENNVRRTYSICSSVAEDTLRIGVRVQPDGIFSNYLADELQPAGTLEIMPPSGHFYTELKPTQAKVYAAFVAGSGITPVLSIAKTALETEPQSRFVIFYGNRSRATTMFMEDLWALKNQYPARVSLHFIMSQEPSEVELYQGRLDGDKVQALHAAFLEQNRPDDIFICGPNAMIDAVSAALTSLNYPQEQVHAERFRAILREPLPASPRRQEVPAEGIEVQVLLDGHRQTFHMTGNEPSILDAAADAGLDLPYSCKGGVCSTCRVKLSKGEVEMAINYSLEPWEVEKGFILTCQSMPLTDSVELDYDQA